MNSKVCPKCKNCSPDDAASCKTCGADFPAATPLADILPEATAAFRRMTDRTTEHIEAVRAWLRTQPRSMTCPHDQQHLVNLDESARKSWREDKMCAVYSPCGKCVGQKISDEESRRLGAMGVPSNMLHAKISNWNPLTKEDREEKERVQGWFTRGKGCLVIHGSVGLGKSHLAIGILRESRRGRFITQSAFVKALRDSYDNAKAEDIILSCQQVDVLVMDEMGVSVGGGDVFPAIYDVLNYRYGENKRTIITTNVMPEDIEVAFGDRIADRLRDARSVVLFGKSRRGRR